MEKIYFSGVDRLKYLQLLHGEDAPVMISPPSKALNKNIENYLQSNKIDCFLDSGIFAKSITIDRYIEIILETGDIFTHIANIDCIGDQEKSNKNFEILINQLPNRLAKKMVWVHQGGELKEIPSYAKEFDLIAVGGLVPHFRKPEKIKTYLESVVNVVQGIDCKIHLFGMTNPYLLRWASFHDCFYSADSTRWMWGLKSGEILAANGSRIDATAIGLRFTPEERARHNVRVLKSFCNSRESFQYDLFNGEVA